MRRTHGEAHLQEADSRRAHGCVYMRAHLWICVYMACMYMYVCAHVYAYVNVYTSIGITNKHPRTKLPGIAAAKREVWQCPRGGKL